MKQRKIITLAVIVSVLLTLFMIHTNVNADQLKSDPENPKNLYVTGTGVIKAEPDMAIISGGIVTQEEEAALSQARNNELTKNVITAMLEADIAEEDIQTVSYNVSPVYSYKSGEEPKLIGYKTTHQLSIAVKNLDALGELIDLAMETGMNQIQGIRFDMQHREELQRQAIEAATVDARTKAEAAIKPEGLGLVELQELHVLTSDSATPTKRNLDGGAPESTGSMVMPGTQSIVAQVQATYTFACPPNNQE
jgi:uncharacterized protein